MRIVSHSFERRFGRTLALLLILVPGLSLPGIEAEPQLAPVGHVAFISPYMVAFNITEIVDGKEAGPDIRTKGKEQVRLAILPGIHEFMIRGAARLSNWSDRVKVRIEANAVVCVSVRKRETSKATILDLIYYRLSTSIGAHYLPFDEEGGDPAPYISALEDEDWGTRLISVKNLRRLKPALQPRIVSLIARMAREDEVFPVRWEAKRLAKGYDGGNVDEPLFLETFENCEAGWCEITNSPDFSQTFVPKGYLFSVRDDRIHFFSVLLNGVSKKREAAGFDAAIECEWLDGGQNYYYGMILGMDNNNYYSFRIAKNGYAQVTKTIDGENVSIPVAENLLAGKTIADQAVSRIIISKRGETYTMSVNGATVGSFKDEQGVPPRVLGPLVAGKQSILFSKIVVTAPAGE